MPPVTALSPWVTSQGPLFAVTEQTHPFTLPRATSTGNCLVTHPRAVAPTREGGEAE